MVDKPFEVGDIITLIDAYKVHPRYGHLFTVREPFKLERYGWTARVPEWNNTMVNLAAFRLVNGPW